jgi:hypothetical protein
MNKISVTCNQLIGYMAYLIVCTPQQTQTQSLTQTNLYLVPLDKVYIKNNNTKSNIMSINKSC